MKTTTITALLAFWAGTAIAAFDKDQPWGKRDYSCVNVFQGIPDFSTVAPGSTIQIRFSRAPTSRCPDPLTQYPGDPYSVWLYNNPVRDRDLLNFDHSARLVQGIPEADGSVTITIPSDLPDVNDSSLWYLRVATSLSTAPQMPTLFNAAGPFTIAGNGWVMG